MVDAPLSALRPAVQRWHQLAMPIIGTKPFDLTWADFVYAWPRVRFPNGREPMRQILARADAGEPPNVALQYEAPETRRLVCLCRELQRASGNEPFFLSCRTAAGLLQIDHHTAWRRLNMLVADGVLTITAPGTKTKATRFKYVAESFGADKNTSENVA